LLRQVEHFYSAVYNKVKWLMFSSVYTRILSHHRLNVNLKIKIFHNMVGGITYPIKIHLKNCKKPGISAKTREN